MSRAPLIDEIGEWLIDQALGDPDIIKMFEHVCFRLHAIGVPVGRARLTWPTLHPLFQAETVLWKRDQEIEFEQFMHQDEVSEEWIASPMNYMFTHGLESIRRNLDGPNKMLDFPVLSDLLEQGYTDYLMIGTSFDRRSEDLQADGNGILVAWACEREGGFTEDDINALKTIQRRFAVACKTAVQNRIATNITETYLGRHAGRRVLDGAIKLGDGHEQQAIVWYSDMRNSTAMADTMPPEAMLDLLKDYFACTAGPVIEFGGEVLDFIGDAVLAIFPYDDEAGKIQAVHMATMAMDKARRMSGEMNAERRKAQKVPFEFGIGITCGSVTFGNIGVDTRLAFTVIGSVVNEVTRIETMTKSIECQALVTAAIADIEPDRWQSTGNHCLHGVSQACELFIPKPQADAVAAKAPNSKQGRQQAS